MTDNSSPKRVFHPLPSSNLFQDLTGHTYGDLKVLGYAPPRKQADGGEKRRWYCLCVCGSEKIYPASNLRNGNTTSCGCLKGSKIREANTTHGGSKTQMYSTWTSMLNRCKNPNEPAYPRYGGRGIEVCERWSGENGFLNFVADMGARPSPGMSVDRIDNSKGYGPDNCRWATQSQQCRNARSNHLLEFNGKIQCVALWAEEYGISPNVIFNRVYRGWSNEEAITTPLKKAHAHHP